MYIYICIYIYINNVEIDIYCRYIDSRYNMSCRMFVRN